MDNIIKQQQRDTDDTKIVLNWYHFMVCIVLSTGIQMWCCFRFYVLHWMVAMDNLYLIGNIKNGREMNAALIKLNNIFHSFYTRLYFIFPFSLWVYDILLYLCVCLYVELNGRYHFHNLFDPFIHKNSFSLKMPFNLFILLN